MKRLLDDARHPKLSDILENWERSRNEVSLDEFSKLSDIPLIQSVISNFSKNKDLQFLKFDYIPLSRNIVAAQALRSVAKALEAFDAATFCNDKAITSSAMLLSYNSTYFAAKSFCYLCGFSPIDRDSALTLDVFIESSQENTNFAYKYGRWGHSEVWKLTKRLVETFKRDFEKERSFMRKARLTSTPKLRNAYSYNDNLVSMFENLEFLNYPDFSQKKSPVEFTKNLNISKALLSISISIIDEAGMSELLKTQASPRRLKLVA